jgi:DNA repair protein RadD
VRHAGPDRPRRSAPHGRGDLVALPVGHDAKTVGLTATPERLDGRGLKDHFDELVVGPSVKRLIADGWLSPYRYFAPGEPDLAGVKVLGGDFNRGDIARVMGRPR